MGSVYPLVKLPSSVMLGSLFPDVDRTALIVYFSWNDATKVSSIFVHKCINYSCCSDHLTLADLLLNLFEMITPRYVLFDVCSAPDWKVPTSCIYGTEDWMDYNGAVEARERMNVPCEIIRVPQVCHVSML